MARIVSELVEEMCTTKRVVPDTANISSIIRETVKEEVRNEMARKSA